MSFCEKIVSPGRMFFNLPYSLLSNDRCEGCEGRSQSAQGIHIG
jgi:hypothetical protein